MFADMCDKCVHRYSSSQVTSDSVSRSETCRSVLFEIEIPCILLFLNWNKNSQNSPKRMHPKFMFSYQKKSGTGKQNINPRLSEIFSTYQSQA